MGAPRVTVVGLGPGPDELVTSGTLAAVARVPVRYLRTERHPSAHLVPDATSFDRHYEAADRFEAVYAGIVGDLVAAAERHGEVLYAVPGSPFVLERSVELLQARPGVHVDVLPAVSFLELAWSRLGVDPFADGVRVVDGHRFAERAAGERGPLLVAHVHNRRVLSEVKLAPEGDDVPRRAVVLQRLGLPDEAVFEVAWHDLDRSFEPDHLTSLWVPELAAPVGAELVRLAEVVRTLRRDCPWDRQQTHRSLTRYLLEESYEVLEAIDHLGERGDGDDALEEELGDLLFQVVLHAALAAEEGRFTLADVARRLTGKLVHRHPHVFAGLAVSGADEVVANWEAIKQAEKGRTSAMDGIPAALPALLLAHEVQRKAAGAGVGWRTLLAGDEDRLALALLEAVDAARSAGVDAEDLLRRTANRLRDRFDAQQ